MAVLLDRRFLLPLGPAVFLAALVIGLPTDVLPNPWFSRMTPVRDLDLALWPLTSVAIGALLATIPLSRATRNNGIAVSAGSGVASSFAVGCPVCNKLVVAALGVSGALNYFGAIQPFLGMGALLVTVVVLRQRIRALTRGCPIDAASAVPAVSAPN